MTVAPHDVYFTIGETVGQPEALFPDCGLTWQYTPPAVFLPAWPPTPVDSAAPYTTVTNWWGAWMDFRGENYANRKRDGFFPFLDLPRSPLRLDLLDSLPLPFSAILQQGAKMFPRTHANVVFAGLICVTLSAHEQVDGARSARVRDGQSRLRYTPAHRGWRRCLRQAAAPARGR